MSLPEPGEPTDRRSHRKKATDRLAEVGDRYRKKRLVNRVREMMQHTQKNSRDQKK